MLFPLSRSFGLAALLSLGLAGCMSSGGTQSPSGTSGELSLFSKWFAAQKTEPAPQADVPCPKVEIREGGATLRQGKGSDVSVQFSLRDVARECSAGKNGAIVMKIGVEGIAVIGKAGKPGGVSAPLIVTATKNDKVIATKTITLKTTIPSDENQTQFRLIDQGFTVPAGSEDADVTIGFKG
jgi:hypothetical protein